MTRWSYVETCLNLLEKLKTYLEVLATSSSPTQPSQNGVPVLRPDTLSVSQQQNVAALLQLVRNITTIHGCHQRIIISFYFQDCCYWCCSIPFAWSWATSRKEVQISPTSFRDRKRKGYFRGELASLTPAYHPRKVLL